MSYPLPVFHFAVDWSGRRGGFTEVTGLDLEVQVIEYREGNSPDYAPSKMPGIPKYTNIVLKRGIMAGDNDFFDWVKTTRLNQTERRDVTISLLNEDHEPVVTWDVSKAWVTKIEGPGLKASGNQVAIESMELAHEGFVIRHD